MAAVEKKIRSINLSLFITTMRKHSFIALLCVAVLCTVQSQAQSQSFEEYKKKATEAYRSYVKEKITAFENFRAERNKEFASYLQKKWMRYEQQPEVEPPVRPKPVVPDPKDDTTIPSRLPVLTVKPIKKPDEPVDVTVKPLPRNVKPSEALQFDFYGTRCRVRFAKNKAFALSDISEQYVAQVWKELVSPDYSTLLDDCIAYRSELKLCDWAYVKFTEQVAKALFGNGKPNEAALLQAFLLMQSGYDAKVVRFGDERLMPALSADNQIYGFTFFVNNGRKYYLLEKIKEKQPIYTYGEMFYDKAQPCALGVLHEQQLPVVQAAHVTRVSSHYPAARVETRANDNLMAFYNDFPHCDWTVYARTPMTREMRDDVLTPLRAAIQGKGEVEAANILLDFVQTGFAYKTDEQQFGYERPLFVDEVFFYPYCDCEDRAILYVYLVHELLGLDVALLYYPMHLAAAVAFNVPVDGDSMMINGRKYLVCDPTIISGASVGEAMKRYKNTKATVYTVEY